MQHTYLESFYKDSLLLTSRYQFKACSIAVKVENHRIDLCVDHSELSNKLPDELMEQIVHASEMWTEQRNVDTTKFQRTNLDICK